MNCFDLAFAIIGLALINEAILERDSGDFRLWSEVGIRYGCLGESYELGVGTSLKLNDS